MKNVKINTEYITLAQFLKYESILSSGGIVKLFLSEYQVLVNGEVDQRKGRKLYPNDIVEIEDIGTYKIVN